MPATIKNAKVAGRRELHFNNLQDIAADVDQLAQTTDIRTLGNWSAGQVLQHLAIVTNKSIDGFQNQAPAPIRFVVRLLFKRRFLTKPMSAGYQLSGKLASEIMPPETTLEEGLQNFRQAFARLTKETQRFPHPALGSLTREEWDQFYCRHAELHLSFLVPGE